jgi:hypothetical protein
MKYAVFQAPLPLHLIFPIVVHQALQFQQNIQKKRQTQMIKTGNSPVLILSYPVLLTIAVPFPFSIPIRPYLVGARLPKGSKGPNCWPRPWQNGGRRRCGLHLVPNHVVGSPGEGNWMELVIRVKDPQGNRGETWVKMRKHAMFRIKIVSKARFSNDRGADRRVFACL